MINGLFHILGGHGVMIEKEQALLVKVLDLFAQRFDKKAVLCGGMVLRILGCERLTNDLDYIFVPYKSKKDIVKNIVSTLQEIDGAKVKYSLNSLSTCVRFFKELTGSELSDTAISASLDNDRA